MASTARRATCPARIGYSRVAALPIARGRTPVRASRRLTVRHLTERVVVMTGGRVVEDRPTEELFRDPHHPYTATLLAAAPRMGALARMVTR